MSTRVFDILAHRRMAAQFLEEWYRLFDQLVRTHTHAELRLLARVVRVWQDHHVEPLARGRMHRARRYLARWLLRRPIGDPPALRDTLQAQYGAVFEAWCGAWPDPAGFFRVHGTLYCYVLLEALLPALAMRGVVTSSTSIESKNENRSVIGDPGAI